MREIKFRAWYNDKELLEVDTIFFRNNKLNVYLKKDNNIFGQGKCNVILEQYTGLKDKNRVEIYEGDIVIFGWGEYQGIIIYFNFSFYVQSEYSLILLSDTMLTIEKIGNIHEGIKNA